jgi:hypothetical protein
MHPPIQDFISDEYFATSLVRPWGRDGDEVDCYGVDLDALYVNTGFRVAIMDLFRGPARQGRPPLCRFAGPDEVSVCNGAGREEQGRDVSSVVCVRCVCELYSVCATLHFLVHAGFTYLLGKRTQEKVT